MPAAVDPGTEVGWVETRPWLVTEVRDEAPEVVTLALAPPAPFRFAPGQFNMIAAPGIGEVPISISGDPDAGSPVLHTIRDVGPVTHALCALRAGQHAHVRGPYGTSWPLAAAAGGDLVIVAGGIGLPPLRPAVYAALRHRDRYGRITLLYGARTPADLLFGTELADWRDRRGVDVRVTVDAAGKDWPGTVGVVPALIPGAISPNTGLAASTTAFVVGPEVMMRFTVRALLLAGVAARRIYLSMERNMQCAAALCGHCQFGPILVCRDGPVLSYEQVGRWLTVREL
jgi:NAD(P)H-flavin reductase